MIAFLDLDKENDLLYIALDPVVARARGTVSHSERQGENLVLDFDDTDRLVGIEVMDASKVMGLANLSSLDQKSFAGLKEAAAMVGVERSNFIRDYVRRAEFPKPVIEVASGPIWLRRQIEEFLASRRKAARRSPTRRAVVSAGRIRR